MKQGFFLQCMTHRRIARLVRPAWLCKRCLPSRPWFCQSQLKLMFKWDEKNTENRIQSFKFGEHYGSGAPQTSIRWEQSHRKPIENVLKLFSVAKERKKWFQRVTHFCCREKECRTTFGFLRELDFTLSGTRFLNSLISSDHLQMCFKYFFYPTLKKDNFSYKN